MLMKKRRSISWDEVEISVYAGRGGNGCVGFRRERGPNGGDGGRGGDVLIKTDPTMSTLFHLVRKRRFKAERGGHGQGKNRHGKNGKNSLILIPKGTLLSFDGEEIDLIEDNQTLIVAKGGKGGRGNSRFATPTCTTPRFAEQGEAGEEKEIHLELRLIANVGIIGFPNAGKSTLLSKLSDAHPKIANYPFTTLTPNLGVVKNEEAAFTIADIPGLIPGAHSGKGLGDRFLRHIRRTKVLLHLLDGEEEDPAEKFYQLNEEMRLYDEEHRIENTEYRMRNTEEPKFYNEELLKKQQVVCLSKSDLDGSNERLKATCDKLKMKVIPISALSGEGLNNLLSSLTLHLGNTQVSEAELTEGKNTCRKKGERGNCVIVQGGVIKK
jgi:GTP-binding protein